MNLVKRQQKQIIKSLIYGKPKSTNRIYVYLHGSGEFGKGPEGQSEYPGFATLLDSNAINLKQPFVIACAMSGTHWHIESLHRFLQAIRSKFSANHIDLIGYSRGGEGVYDYLKSYDDIRSSTVINSEIPRSFTGSHSPLHVIHSDSDQFTPLSEVRNFVNGVEKFSSETTLTEWKGDHFSIGEIAKWRGLYRWIEADR